jgi:uncharacterized surface protein with fasciclin (FAS1) repeats
MKKLFVLSLLSFLLWSCNSGNSTDPGSTTTEIKTAGGQDAVKDDESQKDVVKIAAGSNDHTTLVAAVKKAELVDDLSNAGPFTVFAPTNAAFDKLPKGTVEDLMKDENKSKLEDILQYHVFVGRLSTDYMQDGQSLNQVNGSNITISKGADGKVKVNNSANVVATIPAANGIIHVIDAVLLPPSKQ